MLDPLLQQLPGFETGDERPASRFDRRSVVYHNHVAACTKRLNCGVADRARATRRFEFVRQSKPAVPEFHPEQPCDNARGERSRSRLGKVISLVCRWTDQDHPKPPQEFAKWKEVLFPQSCHGLAAHGQAPRIINRNAAQSRKMFPAREDPVAIEAA